jgi:hypothetical protein
VKDLRKKAEASKLKDMADVHHERMKNGVVEPATVAATLSAAGIKAAAAHSGVHAAARGALALDPAEIRLKLEAQMCVDSQPSRTRIIYFSLQRCANGDA